MNAPKITQSSGTFSLMCRVEVNIQATPHRVWTVLTDAPGFPRWNSTVTAVEGEIRDGRKLRIRVPGTDRTFSPTISGFVTNERMTWTGGFAPMFKGVRTFELKQKNDGTTDFTMQECLSGLMLPLAKGSMPDFGPIFTTYASDLKREAERTML